ncbi:TPA: serine protease [bacterium]|nr:serine protease [bacterium]
MKTQNFIIGVLFSLLINFSICFGSSIGIIEVSGVINPITARFIKNNINKLEKEDFSLLIMKIDTPGGLVTSTHEIVKDLLNSKIPVCTYIYPKGARAASAGVFICLASDIIAMAPSTHMGAAHPVAMGEGMPEKVEEKILNDLVAQIKGIAKERGRNVEWAEKAVRESKTITEEEAIKNNICDIIADDVNELIKKLDGWSVKRDTKVITLRTKDKRIVEIKMSFREKFLHALAEPNIAYIFLILGIYGLIYEFASPGIGLGAVLGSIFLLLAFFGLSNLSINLVGLLLIILGFILLIAEIKAQTQGIFTIGGGISLLLGSFMLIDQGVSPELAISKTLVLSVVGSTILLFFILISLGLKAQFRKVHTGSKGMIGMKGIAGRDKTVFVDGELWKIKSDDEIKEGDEIEVIGIEGLCLKVKKKI